MEDTISRQAVLGKFEPWLKVKDYNDGELNMLKAILYEIRFMPSVTDKNVGTKLGTNLAEVGTDSISRQQVIGALRNYLVGKNVPCDGTLTCRLIENEVISKLPSAQSEIVRCKDCDWWTKQEDSLQGRCALLQMYPTGGWSCGNARRREVTE